MLEVFPPGHHLRRRQLLRAGALAGLVIVLGLLGLRFTEWPWFGIDAAILLVLAIAVSIPRVRRGLWPGKPWIPWSALAVLTGLFVVHSYSIELLRQRSDRFDVLGVRIPVGPGQIFSIGADDSVDVRLEMPADSITRWKMVLRRTDADIFELISTSGVDGLQQIHRDSSWFGENEWHHKTGIPLISGDAAAIIRHASNPLLEHRIWIADNDGSPSVVWNTSSAPLRLRDDDSPGAEVQNSRTLRRLKHGLRLDELRWNRVPDSVAARGLVLFLTKSPKNGLTWIPRFNRYEFQLVSRSNQWSLASGQIPKSFASGDSVQVFANGYRWVFGMDVVYPSAYRKGQVEVSFGRSPSRRVGWLPAAGVCQPLFRCTLISNQPLPPAIPYFDISAFGLDTARFSFLARVSVSGNRIDVVTPRETYSGVGDTSIFVAAQPRFQGDAAGYRLGTFRIAKAGFTSLIATLIGLAMLVTGIALIPSIRSHYGTLLAQNSLAVNSAWAFASIGTVLVGIRLALGYRVTYAAPYADRGADTAVGLCVTLILSTAMLLGWKSWAPHIVRVLLAFERLVTGVDPRGDQKRSRDIRSARLSRDPEGAAATTWPGIVLIILGLVTVAWFRASAVGPAIVISALILICWILLEYLGSQQSEASVAKSVAEVLDMETPDPDWGRGLALAMVSAGIPASVHWPMLALPGSIALLVLSAIMVISIWRKSRRKKIDAEPIVERHQSKVVVKGKRWGASIVASSFLVVLNLILLGFKGPALLFIGVFFLFLLAVRLGHHVGAAVYERKIAVAAVGLMVLAGAVSMVLPIDFGLLLVLGIPLGVAFLITLRIERIPWFFILAGGLAVLVAAILIKPVLLPDATGLLKARQARETSAAFYDLGGPLSRWWISDLPARRSVVRALAANEPEALERVLVSAAPSMTREQIVPALEQIWGGRAYAASGFKGKGLANQTAIGRGISAPVSYAENTFSVYVLAEHGFLGGLIVIMCYIVFICTAGILVWGVRRESSGLPVPDDTELAVVVGGVMMLAVPALYVAAANIGLVPLTGQNMPFLGLNAWSDVAFVGALMSAMLALLLDTAALTNSPG